ncbi:MAG TPA: hypothetical protein VJ570_06370 [Holophagaceae bacterium]|nr:hypothetical protein [Holophagaceae bacterium]
MRACIPALVCMLAVAQEPSGFGGLRWRMVGPFRGGRTVAADGVPGRPHTFYIGVNNGGVWKTTDAGRTWNPIFDDQPTGSIGALAVAPSKPDVLYVGSGEGLHRPDLSTGNGVYRSDDAGNTWRHLGLDDAQQIGAVLVDPRDPNRCFVAALGHPYGPNATRGVFRTRDGGATWEKVLYRDAHTGAVALAFDPANPDIVYASLWQARQAPWENGAFKGPGTGFFKSTDGGTTWAPAMTGLPTEGLGRIGFAVAPSDGRRLYAQVEAGAKSGTYRSDDAGAHWIQVNAERRVSGRGDDFAEIKVHPRNPEVVFAANTSTYRSDDGGKTWTAIKGAPGGDDYHTIWISPEHPEIMLLAADQGAVVTLNGGDTWSSWYNQPTAQFYHVAVDDRFPYRIYGGQQESGSVVIKSRGDHGRITFRDWMPAGFEEYGYAAPDPLHPGVVFGGKLTRFDEATSQTQSVGPRALKGEDWRFLRTAPVVFSPVDPRTLYYAGNVIFKSTDYGRSWEVISGDLSRPAWAVPATVVPYAPTATRRGVVYALAPSPKVANLLWAGTDDGLIHRTIDGRTWTDVTPKQLAPWMKVSMLEAGHFDVQVAYAAINTLRLDDLRPHLLRTRDGGATWVELRTGIPDGETVNAVREDPVRPGLLYAATERTVYVSLDDGAHWKSLRQNLPVTSVRDLVVKGDDLVIATHGRGFWVLDDISPLRQLPEAGATCLFVPQVATRVRWNLNPDTPLPPDEPAGQNPPDGAILHYRLAAPAREVSLEIHDAAGCLVRRYASGDAPEPPEQDLAIPTYWIRPTQGLPTTPGLHRFVWDLHHTRAQGQPGEYPIAAVAKDTARSDQGPWALPGRYTVTLRVDGTAATQPLDVRMDPRVTTPLPVLQRQLELSLRLRDAIGRLTSPDRAALREELSERLAGLQESDLEPTEATVAAAEAALAKAR